jgi:uncharacterized protein involved in exopolysaccharide biosynthesis
MKMHESREFSVKAVIEIIKLHRKSLAIFISVFMALLIIYSLIMPQTYVSSATMLPPDERDGGSGLSGFLSSMAGGGISIGDLGKSNEVKIYADILKSRSVAQYIQDELHLKEKMDLEVLSDAQFLKLIQDIIQVEIEKSGLIIVSAGIETPYFPGNKDKQKSAKIASEIANHAIEGLDHVLRNKNVSIAKKTRQYIQNELIKYKSRLDSVETEMEDFQRENKVLAIDEQTVAIVEQAIQVGNDLAIARINYNLAQQEMEPGSPKLVNLRNKVNYLEKQYKQIQSGGISTDEFSIPLGEIPTLARKYADLMREREILEQVILYLETQRHQEAIQEEKDVPVVEVLDEARPPEQRSSPRRSVMVILGLVIISIVGVLAVLVHAFRKGRIYFAEAEE